MDSELLREFQKLNKTLETINENLEKLNKSVSNIPYKTPCPVYPEEPKQNEYPPPEPYITQPYSPYPYSPYPYPYNQRFWYS